MNDSSKLVITSHNICGFDNSKEFLHSQCDNDNISVLAIQEHWLRPPFRKNHGTNRLKQLHPKYDAHGVSGMTKAIDNQIIKGRPFGGTGFLYKKSIAKSIRPRIDLNHERVSVLELKITDHDVFLINAYFPYFDSSRLHDQLIIYRETLAFVENILKNNPFHKYILMADFNCNLYEQNHPYSILVNDFMREYGLVSCFDSIPNFDHSLHYTRCDVKKNSYTFIDCIVVSHSLQPLIENAEICHHHLNVSDHIPLRLTLNVNVESFLDKKKTFSNYIPWNSLKEEELYSFRYIMTYQLDQIQIPITSINHYDVHCTDDQHALSLEKYYYDIVEAVVKADQSLPRRKHGISKPFWSPELNELKQKSFDAFILWKSAGCPRSGVIYNEKISTHAQYKRQLRISKRTETAKFTDNLSQSLLNRDSNTFWKNYKNINSGNVPPSAIIDGSVNDDDIVKSFSNCYSSVYVDSDANSRLKNKFEPIFKSYYDDHVNESINPFLFTWDDMLNAVIKLKLGKATGSFITAYHVFHGSPKLLIHLHILFNSLLCHGYVPHEFLCSTITPVIKDRNGDASSPSNYRPVSLGVVFSQLFEYLLLAKLECYLISDDLQFGFKSKHSTSHAVFVLKSCVDYFQKYGSTTFVTFLDCTKAFDKVSHYGLFIKLIERGIPLCFLRILIYWYLNMASRCKWNDVQGEYFDVLTGVKQGGVLSPRLFAIYVDDLIIKLRARGIGCHIIEMFVACLFFADDLCLISPTRSAMQELLSLCEEYCSEFNLTFNAKKSKTLIFGKPDTTIKPLLLNGNVIDIVNEWRYLGTTIVAGKSLSFSAKSELRAFYCSTNSLLSAKLKPDETVLMHLLFSICVPTITYASEIKQFSSSEMHSCHVAMNDAIRRIFGYNRWESIRSLRQTFGYNDLYSSFQRRRNKFLEGCTIHGNQVVRGISAIIE